LAVGLVQDGGVAIPEFGTQKPSVKIGIDLPQLTGRGFWCSIILA